MARRGVDDRRRDVRSDAGRCHAHQAARRRSRDARGTADRDRQAGDRPGAASARQSELMADHTGLPPLHLQLAGPAARPNGHPGHAFVFDQLAVGEYPTPEDAFWLRETAAVTAVVSLQDESDLDRKGLSLASLERAYAAQGIAFHRLPVA